MIEKINTKALYKICQEQKLLPEDITYKEFFTIALEFNKEVSKEVVGGYIFQSPIGTFSITKGRKVTKVIDWKRSFSMKQKLIDEGRIPYNERTAPEGEYWLVYYTNNIRFKWQWKKVREIRKWFIFLPCIANKRLMGNTISKKIEEQTDNYNGTAPQDYIKPVHSFQDFQNFQTT